MRSKPLFPLFFLALILGVVGVRYVKGYQVTECTEWDATSASDTIEATPRTYIDDDVDRNYWCQSDFTAMASDNATGHRTNQDVLEFDESGGTDAWHYEGPGFYDYSPWVGASSGEEQDCPPMSAYTRDAYDYGTNTSFQTHAIGPEGGSSRQQHLHREVGLPFNDTFIYQILVDFREFEDDDSEWFDLTLCRPTRPELTGDTWFGAPSYNRYYPMAGFLGGRNSTHVFMHPFVEDTDGVDIHSGNDLDTDPPSYRWADDQTMALEYPIDGNLDIPILLEFQFDTSNFLFRMYKPGGHSVSANRVSFNVDVSGHDTAVFDMHRMHAGRCYIIAGQLYRSNYWNQDVYYLAENSNVELGGTTHDNALFRDRFLNGFEHSGWKSYTGGGSLAYPDVYENRTGLVQLQDSNGADYVYIESPEFHNDDEWNLWTGPVSGIVEFGVYVPSAGTASDVLNMYFKSTGGSALFNLYLFHTGNYIRYYDGSYHTIGTYTPDTWHVYTMEFNCETETTNIYKDGTLLQANAPFDNSGDFLSDVQFRTSSSGQKDYLLDEFEVFAWPYTDATVLDTFDTTHVTSTDPVTDGWEYPNQQPDYQTGALEYRGATEIAVPTGNASSYYQDQVMNATRWHVTADTGVVIDWYPDEWEGVEDPASFEPFSATWCGVLPTGDARNQGTNFYMGFGMLDAWFIHHNTTGHRYHQMRIDVRSRAGAPSWSERTSYYSGLIPTHEGQTPAIVCFFGWEDDTAVASILFDGWVYALVVDTSDTLLHWSTAPGDGYPVTWEMGPRTFRFNGYPAQFGTNGNVEDEQDFVSAGCTYRDGAWLDQFDLDAFANALNRSRLDDAPIMNPMNPGSNPTTYETISVTIDSPCPPDPEWSFHRSVCVPPEVTCTGNWQGFTLTGNVWSSFNETRQDHDDVNGLYLGPQWPNWNQTDVEIYWKIEIPASTLVTQLSARSDLEGYYALMTVETGWCDYSHMAVEFDLLDEILDLIIPFLFCFLFPWLVVLVTGKKMMAPIGGILGAFVSVIAGLLSVGEGILVAGLFAGLLGWMHHKDSAKGQEGLF